MDTRNTASYRIGVVALLTFGTFINAVDRASLSVAVPSIIKDFGIDTATMGIALSAFFWAYALGNAPARIWLTGLAQKKCWVGRPNLVVTFCANRICSECLPNYDCAFRCWCW